MMYEKPTSDVDFFAEIVGMSNYDWESEIDPDVTTGN